MCTEVTDALRARFEMSSIVGMNAATNISIDSITLEKSVQSPMPIGFGVCENRLFHMKIFMGEMNFSKSTHARTAAHLKSFECIQNKECASPNSLHGKFTFTFAVRKQPQSLFGAFFAGYFCHFILIGIRASNQNREKKNRQFALRSMFRVPRFD